MMELFLRFARVGAFAFGGGPSMIPLLKSEAVAGGFVDDARFAEAYAVCSALPGPIATKLAVYVGYHHAGAPGALSALLGLLAPSTILVALSGAVVARWREHPAFAAGLAGLNAAVVGMLVFTAWDLGPAGVRDGRTLLLAVVAFVALLLRVHPVFVVVGSMIAGALLLRS